MRLIDADALKKALDEQMNFDENCRDSVFAIIDNASTIEQKYYERIIAQINPVIEERPHGEWIIIKSPLSDEIIVKCPICGDEFIGNDVQDYNFCPNCGAYMGGNDNE